MARYRVGLETRDRILAATRDLLAEGGLEGATLKAICEQAGIQPGSFYNLFGSKEEVVLTVVRQAITAVDPDPSGTGSDTVFDLVAAYVRFITEEEPLARVYLRMAVGGALTDRAMAGRVLRHHQARVLASPRRWTVPLPAPTTRCAPRRWWRRSTVTPCSRCSIPGFDFAMHAERLVADGTLSAAEARSLSVHSNFDGMLKLPSRETGGDGSLPVEPSGHRVQPLRGAPDPGPARSPSVSDLDEGTMRAALAESRAAGPKRVGRQLRRRRPNRVWCWMDGEVELPRRDQGAAWRRCVTEDGTASGSPRNSAGSGSHVPSSGRSRSCCSAPIPRPCSMPRGRCSPGLLLDEGTPEQQQMAALMIERGWAGSMVLTEPDAGSDVGAGTTRAVHVEGDMWHLEGVKRFITGGEHDGAENIIHLVLARPVGAGPGTKGLSLFMVPKWLVEPDGSLGERNGIFATRVEHKMGLKGSTTCELTLGAGRSVCRLTWSAGSTTGSDRCSGWSSTPG